MIDKGNINRITESMRRIHKDCAKPESNYYNNYRGADESVIFDIYEGTNAVVFCIKEANIYRAFYYSADTEELAGLLRNLPKGTVLDIVCREEEIEPAWLPESGFEYYTTYIRFGMKVPSYEEEIEKRKDNILEQFYKEEYGEPAKRKDISEIQERLAASFDAKTDHLFTDEQIGEMIDEGDIYVERDETGIFCIVIRKIEGRKFYYNLTYNTGTADVSYSIEKKLLLDAIKQYGVNYSYSWIDKRNKKALKRNTAPKDGLFNHIFERS